MVRSTVVGPSLRDVLLIEWVGFTCRTFPCSFSSFSFCLSVRRNGEMDSNVVRNPRLSDPVETMKDSIHPSIIPLNSDWIPLSLRHRRWEASIRPSNSKDIQCQSTTTSDPSRYSICEGSVRPFKTLATNKDATWVYRQCHWTTCDPSLNTSTAREVRSACPYILQTRH